MHYRTIPVTPFAQNCTLLWTSDTKDAVVVDPGGDISAIHAACADEGARLTKIWLTHPHIDHAGGVAELARSGLTIEGPHRDDRFWIDALEQQAAMFGLESSDPFEPDRWLKQGDHVELGNLKFDVLHCPGHTPGHVVFFHSPSRLALVGDVLFKGSVGRSDLPGGDHAALLRSIKELLLPLGDDVVFIPGHGPTSTFGEERLYNPFLQST